MPNQYPGRRTAPGANHDRHGRSQTESARAGNDQHRHGIHQGIGHAWLWTVQTPDDAGEHSDHHHTWDKIRRHHVCQALDRGARALCLAYQTHNLGQEGITAHALSPHQETTRAIDCASCNPATRCLLYWDRLTGEHGFIDRATPFQHHTIHRDLLTRADAERIANLHLLKRYIFFSALLPHDPRRTGCEPKQGADGATRLAPSAQFEHLPQ